MNQPFNQNIKDSICVTIYSFTVSFRTIPSPINSPHGSRTGVKTSITDWSWGVGQR